ncbi:thermonuclease family protein [Amorphus sp. 3PC139-8]|uniref:thermonuclease family protein n=1 Tax=Amorphus sp. 3PC139-8 TaxID=2735676 RepID=UPI00345D12C0
MASYSRARRRSQTLSRVLYAAVVIGAAAASVVPLLLLDDGWVGPVSERMKTLPLGAPNDDPQNAADWGGKTTVRPAEVADANAVEPADELEPIETEPDVSVRDVSSNRITRSPERVAPLQRLPSAVELPPPLPPKPVRYYLVVVEDALTLDAQGTPLKIAQVDGPSTFDTCQEGSPVQWSCDIRARTALRKLVGARAIECLALDEKVARTLEAASEANETAKLDEPADVTCTVGATDIASWLVSQGWAKPAEDAPDRLKVLSWIAQGQKRGLWQPPPPTTQ